jgi:hypothetical protein
MKTLKRLFIFTALIAPLFHANAQIENALHFDGMNDKVTLPTSTHSQITNQGTIEAWINTTANNAGYRGLVVRSTFYGLFLVDNKLSTYIWGGSTPGVVTHSGADLNDGLWHHVAFSFQVGVTGGSQMYLDGQPVGPAITLQVGSTPYPFQLGCNTNIQYYSGKMDDVKIWSRALSAQELANPIACGSNGTTGLVGSYSFNSGNPSQNNSGLTTLTDNSGLNNNGTLNNFTLTGVTSNWVSGYVCECSTPTGDAAQTFCEGAQIANLVAQGQIVEWYDVPTGGTALDPTTVLTDATIYYAAQGGGGCLSTARLAVTVTISGPAPSAPTGASQQFFCTINNSTIAELTAVGTNIKWYAYQGDAVSLLSTSPINQQWYYATQTVNGCESETYLDVFAFETSPTPPLIGDPYKSFCPGATITDLTGSLSVNWYPTPLGGTSFASSDVLTNGETYFASKVQLQCESQQRIPVTVYVAPLDLSVSLDGILLSSNQNYALYKWIDCSTGLIIPNEIYQSYNMLNEGSYSVVVSLPNCSDTTECYPQITLINENSLPTNELVVMPNPASDLITIISSEITQAYITSLNGNVIERVSINGDAIVDVSNYKSGVYFVRTLSGLTSIFIKQ